MTCRSRRNMMVASGLLQWLAPLARPTSETPDWQIRY